MNLPNRITVFRFFMIPVFTVFFILDFKYIALIAFLIASVSDFVDGYIARKKNLVTDFGKLMDPLADKMLVCTALVCFIAFREPGQFICVCTIIILAREFIITGFRQLAVEKGVVIQASYWGKVKTVFQLIACIMFILDLEYEWFVLGGQIVLLIATILTLISIIDYMIKNWNIIKLASK